MDFFSSWTSAGGFAGKLGGVFKASCCGFGSVGADGNVVIVTGGGGAILTVVTTGGFFSVTGACVFVWELGCEFKASCCELCLESNNPGRITDAIKHAAAALTPP